MSKSVKAAKLQSAYLKFRQADADNQMLNGVSNQVTQNLCVQTYCKSVLSQHDVDFSSTPNLNGIQNDVNSRLSAARRQADCYLNIIQPSIISNVASMQSYYGVFKDLPTIANSVSDWKTYLTMLKEQTDTFKKTADDLLAKLRTFKTQLGVDASGFSATVNSLNSIVNGSEGILSSLQTQIDAFQSKINYCIAGIALGGLVAAAGAIVALTGAVTGFITAGTSNIITLGGVAMITTGLAGTGTSIGLLVTYNNEKAKLIRQQAQLKSEVTIASTISTGYKGLAAQASDAFDAAEAMSNAWTFLGAHLGTLITNLNLGLVTPNALSLLASSAAIGNVNKTLGNIENQMSGVKTLTAPQGTDIATFTNNMKPTRTLRKKAA